MQAQHAGTTLLVRLVTNYPLSINSRFSRFKIKINKKCCSSS
jgi:hypothetical protein